MKMSEEPKCLECKQIWGENQNGLECNYCGEWKHESCFKDESEFVKFKKKFLWLCCDNCKDDLGVDDKLLGLDEKAAYSKVECLGIMATLLKEVAKLRKQIKQYETRLEGVECINKEKGNVSQDMSIVNTNEEAKSLKAEIGQIKQKLVNKNAVCFGLKINKPEADLRTLSKEQRLERSKLQMESLKQYFAENNLDSTILKEVKYTYEMHTIKETSNNNPLVCVLKDKDCKTEFIRQINSCMPRDKNLRVRATEFLSIENRQLLTEAKIQLAKFYKYIWSKHGRILIKKKDGDPAKWIKNSEQINAFLEENGENPV